MRKLKLKKISNKLKLKTIKHIYKKLVLISPHFSNCIKIISNSKSYTSGIGLYTNSDFSNINNRLCDSMRDCYLNLLTNKDPRIIKVRIFRNKAVIIMKGESTNYNRYIIFENEDNRNYEPTIEKDTTKKKLRIRNAEEPIEKQKRRKRTISNVSPKRSKRKNKKKS